MGKPGFSIPLLPGIGTAGARPASRGATGFPPVGGGKMFCPDLSPTGPGWLFSQHGQGGISPQEPLGEGDEAALPEEPHIVLCRHERPGIGAAVALA